MLIVFIGAVAVFGCSSSAGGSDSAAPLNGTGGAAVVNSSGGVDGQGGAGGGVQDGDGLTALPDSASSGGAAGTASAGGTGGGGQSTAHVDGGYPGEPTTKASGGTCTVNSDCTDSPAAQALSGVRCLALETYCLDGTCYADCAGSCTVVRTDTNPCPPQRLCTRFPPVCKIVPIRCSQAADCPSYLPPVADGGVGAWSCEEGLCAYPGLVYATR